MRTGKLGRKWTEIDNVVAVFGLNFNSHQGLAEIREDLVGVSADKYKTQANKKIRI